MKHKVPHKHQLPVPMAMGGQPGGRIANPIEPDGNIPPMGPGSPLAGNLPADGAM